MSFPMARRAPELILSARDRRHANAHRVRASVPEVGETFGPDSGRIGRHNGHAKPWEIDPRGRRSTPLSMFHEIGSGVGSLAE
jgi:hypothetical protein